MATVTTANITATINPLWEERTREVAYGSVSARLPYLVTVTDAGDADDDIDALEEYVIAAATEYFDATPVGDALFVRMSMQSAINARQWKVVATFEGRGPWYVEDSFEFDFDTVGGQQHITAPLSTAASYGLSHPGAIGVQGDEVKGADIIIPGFNFAISRILDTIVVNDAYLITLREMSGSVNSDWWHGYAPGEVLFVGASGQRRGVQGVRMTYKFSALINRTSAGGNPVIIPGFMSAESPTPIDKLGWQYLWVQYADDEADNNPVKKPVAVHVENVYPYQTFASLGV